MSEAHHDANRLGEGPNASEPDPTSFIVRWRRRLRTIQAAAVFGLVAAAGWAFVLRTMLKAPGPDATNAEISEYYANVDNSFAGSNGVVVLALATIGFLWFMGVVRGRLGKNAPRLHGTVFLSAGIVFAGLLFVAVAALATPAVLVSETDRVIDPDSAAMTRSFAAVLLSLIIPRIAAVFILSFSTLAQRTGAMEPWVVVLSQVVGLLMMLGVTFSAVPVYLFPAWVGFVSLRLLLRPPARRGSGADQVAQA